MAEEKRRKSAPGGRPEKGKTDRTPRREKGDDDARDRDRARRKRSGGALAKVKRLAFLVLVLVLLVGGYIGYKVGWDPDKLTKEELTEIAKESIDQTKASWQKLDVGKMLGDLDDYFDKNPNAKKIETKEELEVALAEPEPAAPEPPPEAAEPDPKTVARTEARAELAEAKKILRGWSPGQDKKLHDALEHLDEGLAKAESAGDDSLIEKIQEMRYFCIKSHSTK